MFYLGYRHDDLMDRIAVNDRGDIGNVPQNFKVLENLRPDRYPVFHETRKLEPVDIVEFNLNRKRFGGHVRTDDKKVLPYHPVSREEDKERGEDKEPIDGDGGDPYRTKIGDGQTAIDNPARMDEKRHHRQTDNGIKERDINENDLPGAGENDIDLIEIVVLKDQDDDKGVNEEEIKLRRQDIRIPLPGACKRYAPELQRRRKGEPQEDKIAKSEDNFIASVLHFVRID